MKTVAVSLVVLLGCLGCASDEPTRQMATDDPMHPTGIAHDPVSHVEVGTDSPWKASWQGQWYYFESQENKLRFEVNPEAYLPSERTKPQQRKVLPHQAQ